MKYPIVIVLASLFMVICTGCTQTKLVPVPEIVQVPVYQEYPENLTESCQKTPLPVIPPTYAQVIEYHLLDRACLDDLNKRMGVIRGE